MLEVKNPILLNKIKPFFKDIRFYMGTSALDGSMGQAYTDNLENPKFALLIVRNYCFMSGSITKEKLKKLIDHHLKTYILIPTDPLREMIEKLYQNEIIKSTRHSIKKEVIFDQNKLNKMIKELNPQYHLIKINESIAQQIKDQDFIRITDDYSQNGIGYACYHQQKLIGVASSNIFYQNGIEVNIRVDEAYQRKGIGSALAAQLIIACLQSNKQVSWDAANLKSVGLAEKLGFTYDSPYHTYKFSTPSHLPIKPEP